MRRLFSLKGFQSIVWIFILLYIAYFSIFTVLRYRHLYAEYFDLGIMHQTVYNSYMSLKTGDWSRLLELTNPHGGGEQIKRMAIHNDPILALLAPFYFIYPGPETLLVLQTIVLALGAVALFKISQKIVKNECISFIFALSYLLYAPMQRANIFEFHAVTFATSFILFMYDGWISGRKGLSFIFFILALVCKEEVGLSIGVFGLYLFIKNFRLNLRHPTEKNPVILPLMIMLISWGWALASVFIVTPFFLGGQHFASGYYSNFFQNLIPSIFSKETLHYFLFLLGPIGFLTLLAPEFLIIASPELGINLLSSNTQLRSLYFQYTSVIQPWIFIGAIYGLKRLIRWKGEKMKNLAIRFLLVSVLVFTYLKSPLPGLPEKNIDPLLYKREEEYTFVKKWQSRLTDDSIKVSTTDQIAPFFTSRRYFYIFSPDYIHADYIILSKSNLEFTYREEARTAYKLLRNDQNYTKIAEETSYEVYKKLSK